MTGETPVFFYFKIFRKWSIVEIITKGGIDMTKKKGEETQDAMNNDKIETLVEDGEVENEDKNDETEE